MESKNNLQFPLLAGETTIYTGNPVNGTLVLTNYRLFLQLHENQYHVPLGLIEVVEHRDLFDLHIGCKDARTYRCTFDNNEVCFDWFNRLLEVSAPLKELKMLFAFSYFNGTKKKGYEHTVTNRNYIYDENTFKKEVERLKFDVRNYWRISPVNEKYELCPSYPPQLLVPRRIQDDTLKTVAKFRSSRRIPTVVWRHVGNGAIIARCSQPEVGWLGWRSAEDEDLLKAISEACIADGGPKSMPDNTTSHTPTSPNSDDSSQIQSENAAQEKKKLLIMDARSYTTAVANRARGGGCECPEYYPNCEIQFMYLANIHSIRKSFHALRQLCASSADQPNWYSLLEGTRWLQHMSGLMKAAVTLVNVVEVEARPVLVHCSDGWDRTPQIVALAELLLDPFYRTIEGFRILIEKEWLAFGHKFADRCGHATSSDQNERCPVFLQWLDCVHQLLIQFPCAFEFSQMYLVKLAHHVYSNLFGTFLCNTQKDRVEKVNNETFSVWAFLDTPCFKNHLYTPPNMSVGRRVLWPQVNVRDLYLWSEVYLGSLEIQRTSEICSNSCPGPPNSTTNHMTKTRSYGDLMHSADICQDVIRRKSDPSIVANPPEDIVQNGFLENEIDNNGDNCNNDCLYKNTDQSLSDDFDVVDVKTDPEVVQDSLISNNMTEGSAKFLGNLDSVNLTDICRRETKINNFMRIQDLDALPGQSCILGYSLDGDVGVSFTSKSNLTQIGDHRDSNLLFEEEEDKTKILKNNLNGICPLSLENVISITKTDKLRNEKDLHLNLNSEKTDEPLTNAFENICQYQSKIYRGDINHNGELRIDDVDSDTECTEPSEGKSEKTIVCNIGAKEATIDLVETNMKMLTASDIENCAPRRPMCSEKAQSNSDIFNGNIDYSKHSHQSRSTSGKSSRYSTPLVYSRITSANGCENTLGNFVQYKCANTYPDKLGYDGLVPLWSDVQVRLWQIIEEQKRTEEALKREVHTCRLALMKQACCKCNHYEGEKQDDLNSRVESVCSAGEGQASAVESDLSWEAVEEKPWMQDASPVLWTPNQATSRCTGCLKEFWLCRRRHHCRNCGKIFCAECSEKRMPLLTEQMYEPVRVCTNCYSEIRRNCSEIPNQCKNTTSQTTNTSQQITASSN